jgi:hypothetical protein
MSWLYSLALVEAYSAANCSDGGLSALLKSMPTPRAFCSHGRSTVASLPSLFGMTCERLTVFHGEELLTWFQADSRARISRYQVGAKESPGPEADSGRKWPASLARFDQVSCLWRTLQPSEEGDCPLFSGTWPAWGMMRDGEIYQLPGLARPTKEIDSGLWPTPVASCRSGFKCGAHHEQRRKVRLNHYCFLRGRSDLAHSPTFREWMMGWPENWTALNASETAKFQQWLDSHGKC